MVLAPIKKTPATNSAKFQVQYLSLICEGSLVVEETVVVMVVVLEAVALVVSAAVCGVGSNFHIEKVMKSWGSTTGFFIS